MATQRPVGRGQSRQQSPQQSQQQSQQSQQSRTPRPLVRPSQPAPARRGADLHEPTGDTIWHTRGLQTNTRMRMTMPRRVPPRQLPPSRLPRLLLWGILLAIASMLANAVFHMLR